MRNPISASRQNGDAPSVLRIIGASGLLGIFLILTSHSAAAAAAGGGLPYEGWLANIQASITGPVAFAFAIIGLVVAGAVLIFGGELNGFIRTLMFIALVMALIITAQNMMTFFGTGAALIGKQETALPLLRELFSVVLGPPGGATLLAT
jgi:type IV secretion system protein VirB2